mmetsp:Transcript_4175/g.6181  ORF Transcript_4175/g.6181 Transcript_4175/m.6181 type:complete len:565 (-) Transcript_4175:1695-3389(-)
MFNLMLLFLLSSLCCGQGRGEIAESEKKGRIAVIGGGIGGTFVSKYLVDYDTTCQIDSLTLFDPTFQPNDSDDKRSSSSKQSDGNQSTLQGGRVATKILDDGTVIELGASIIYSGNKLVSSMIDADASLSRISPEYKGFGVWDGKDYRINSEMKTARSLGLRMAYRYSTDIFRMNSAVGRAIKSFDQIYVLLESQSSFFPSSADEIWDAVGLLSVARINFDKYLDSIGVSKDNWWTPVYQDLGMGVLRTELIASANLSNYNQKNSNLNGLSGLVSFVPSSGGMFNIQGGNYKIPISAWKQATLHRKNICSHRKTTSSSIDHVPIQVTSVISRSGEFELWSSQEFLGVFQTVILAAPLQQCQISFSEKVDEADDQAVKPMKFYGLSKVSDDELLLPSSAKRRYTQTVTTIIANATLQESHFNSTFKYPPKTVYFTEEGSEKEKMTTIRHMKDDIYKIFSPDILSEDILKSAFGPDALVVETKVWGGKNGGAYPNFNGGGEASEAPPFLLHDRHGSALYYINGIEAAVSSIEISAIGAKSVAKLVSKRLGFFEMEPERSDEIKEEL